MKTRNFKTFATASLAIVMVALPFAFAHAQLNVKTTASNKISVGSTVVKGKSDAEIDARIAALNGLQARVNEMTKISDSEKASLIASISENLSNMTTLKTKIDTDTDKLVLKSDAASITKSYRIYALILPKTRILAASDRISATVDILTNVKTKLQAGIATAQSNGKDVTAINSVMADMSAKLADASTKGQAAATLVAALQPDQGNASVAASNKTALGTARADIKTSINDLVVALQDAKTAQSSLITLGVTVQ